MGRQDHAPMRLAGATRLCALASALLAFGNSATVKAAEPMLMVGAAEIVRIYPGGAALKARVDTGAATTSINAHQIKTFKKGGKRWVSFEVRSNGGLRIRMEGPVVRAARIKQFDGDSRHRHVVHIGICLGGYYKVAQVTLQDRSKRQFPVLIGRRYMAGAITVDPGRKYSVKPDCRGRR
jgi:hypothetical protein